MKSKHELLADYLSKDEFFQKLTPLEKLLYITEIKETTDFHLYVLKASFKELLESVKSLGDRWNFWRGENK